MNIFLLFLSAFARHFFSSRIRFKPKTVFRKTGDIIKKGIKKIDLNTVASTTSIVSDGFHIKQSIDSMQEQNDETYEFFEDSQGVKHKKVGNNDYICNPIDETCTRLVFCDPNQSQDECKSLSYEMYRYQNLYESLITHLYKTFVDENTQVDDLMTNFITNLSFIYLELLIDTDNTIKEHINMVSRRQNRLNDNINEIRLKAHDSLMNKIINALLRNKVKAENVKEIVEYIKIYIDNIDNKIENTIYKNSTLVNENINLTFLPSNLSKLIPKETANWIRKIINQYLIDVKENIKRLDEEEEEIDQQEIVTLYEETKNKIDNIISKLNIVIEAAINGNVVQLRQDEENIEEI